MIEKKSQVLVASGFRSSRASTVCASVMVNNFFIYLREVIDLLSMIDTQDKSFWMEYNWGLLTLMSNWQRRNHNTLDWNDAKVDDIFLNF